MSEEWYGDFNDARCECKTHILLKHLSSSALSKSSLSILECRGTKTTRSFNLVDGINQAIRERESFCNSQ